MPSYAPARRTSALFTLVLLMTATALGADVSIKPGDEVLKVEIDNADQLKLLLDMDLDVWTHEPGIGPVEVHVSPAERKRVEEAGLRFTVVDPDLMRSHAEFMAANLLANQRGLANPFDSYLPLADIYTFMGNLAAARPDLCTEIPSIGNSIESRPIRVWKITGTGAGPKPGVFYHGLQHAREWITAPTVMYLANHLITSYDSDPCLADLVNRTEFYLAPCVNPDGYSYTWSSTRLWRKNRRNNGDGTFGVDLNRNWAYGWGGGGSSGTTSNDTYRGTAPFSEPETTALSNFMLANPGIRAYMDYHSFSQLILWPYGNVCSAPPPPDDAKFSFVGNTMQQLIESVHGQYYEAGPICTTLYQASGGSVDWAYATAGRTGFTIELRPTSSPPGFELPPDQILPTCEENLPAILFLSHWASDGVLLNLPDGAPTQLSAGQPTVITVSLSGAQETIVPGSALLYYRLNPSDPFTPVPLVLQSGTTYTGTIPAAACGQTAQFYFTASGNGGFVAVQPCGAPASLYSAPVLNIPAPQVAYSYPMSGNPGWTLSTGWAFGVPTGACGDPASGYTGSNVLGYNLTGCYTNNITTVRYATTTAINCSALSGTKLRFRRWLGLESSQYDHANIQVSDNNSTWTTVWNFSGATLAETSWSLQTYDISAVADGKPTVYVRWGMGTTDGGVTGCGWNIDDVEILGVPLVNCGSVALGDVNLDAVVDGLDVDPFVRVLLAPGVATSQEVCAADVNQVCGVTIEDVDPFVSLLLLP